MNTTLLTMDLTRRGGEVRVLGTNAQLRFLLDGTFDLFRYAMPCWDENKQAIGGDLLL